MKEKGLFDENVCYSVERRYNFKGSWKVVENHHKAKSSLA